MISTLESTRCASVLRSRDKADEGYRAVVQDAQRCYEQLRQFVTQMAALAA